MHLQHRVSSSFFILDQEYVLQLLTEFICHVLQQTICFSTVFILDKAMEFYCLQELSCEGVQLLAGLGKLQDVERGQLVEVSVVGGMKDQFEGAHVVRYTDILQPGPVDKGYVEDPVLLWKARDQ